MIVVLSAFEVLGGLVRLELSLGLVSSLLLKKLLHKRIFVAVKYKAILLCYCH